MITYFNIKTSEGVETIDQLDAKDFKTFKDFRKERLRLKNEYLKASSFYSGLYYSQRCTNDWRN